MDRSQFIKAFGQAADPKQGTVGVRGAPSWAHMGPKYVIFWVAMGPRYACIYLPFYHLY